MILVICGLGRKVMSKELAFVVNEMKLEKVGRRCNQAFAANFSGGW